MKFKTSIVAVSILGMAMLSGCMMPGAKYSSGSAGVDFAAAVDADGNEASVERMMIWRADISVVVSCVSNALTVASEIAGQSGGYVEQKSGYSEKRGRVRIRVPSKSLKSTLGALEELGTVTSRSVRGEDVTEQYVDVEARLKNRIVLRDRLQKLLDKADTVKDVLAIEKELNRVQGDVDSMEARMKALKGKVDFATIELSLTRKRILGPLGYMFKGLWWGVEKLFVIRD